METFKAAIRFDLFLLMVLAASLGCSRPQQTQECPEIPGIVLISIDTCRADYLSCYGNSRKTTPNIDQLASHATLFENVLAPAPMTLPSHSSMMTGTNPTYHGVHENLEYRLGDSHVTLAELLQGHGFSTAAVISAFVLDKQFGINQGFDHYDDQFDNPIGMNESSERRGDETSAHAIEWLADHGDERFFLFVHYFDPHHEYAPPEPYASTFADDFYAGEIAYTDHCIGLLLAKLKELNRYDSTLIMVVGDHGEMLGEHGESTHSYFVYQNAIKVPLIVKLPGQVQAQRVRGLAGIVDIVPTLCSLLGVDCPSQVRGMNLSQTLMDPGSEIPVRSVYCESTTPTKYGADELAAIVRDGWKYIHTVQSELYNLNSDPREEINVVHEYPGRVEEIEALLLEMLNEDAPDGLRGSRSELDVQSRRRIESLGYVSGSNTDSPASDKNRIDPRQLIGLHESHVLVSHLVAQKKLSEAAAICRKMIKEHPQQIVAYERLGDIAHEQGDNESALEYWMQVLQKKPNHAVAHNNAGTALAAIGKTADAIQHYQKALTLRPDFAAAHHNLADMLLKSGDADQAINHLQMAVRWNVNDAEAHAKLGRALAERREYGPAVEHLQRALDDKPDFVKARVGLGDTLLLQGRVSDAILHYQSALDLDPNDSDAHNNLGNALLQRQEFDQAMSHFQEALRIRPDFPMAHYNIAVIRHSRGDVDGAVAHYREALRAKSDWLAPMNSLAWILATHVHASSHQPAEAVYLAENAACLSKHADATILDTLAAAYASAGRFDQAVQTAQTALERAHATGHDEQARQIAARLALYQQEKPYVQPPSLREAEDN